MGERRSILSGNLINLFFYDLVIHSAGAIALGRSDGDELQIVHRLPLRVVPAPAITNLL
jgi:hypothetical protein